jgi:branched-chain amino acid transport system ATP-binding protein
MNSFMLSVNDINVYYGAIHALKGLSFHVEEGEIVSLIGANGAGKTTAMHTVSGLLRSKTGDITFMGESIEKMEPHRIVRLGLAQVPEGRRVFSNLTVQENLQMGAYIRPATQSREVDRDLELVFKRFPRLKERRRQQAGTLSGGEQQMLAIGRALMSRPKMMLLDEPSMGLSPILVQEIFSCIREVNESGTTILLVEQNAKMALSISNRAYVLETGSIILKGKSSELLDNEQVRRAYLGA